jgi:hypothetical protein
MPTEQPINSALVELSKTERWPALLALRQPGTV